MVTDYKKMKQDVLNMYEQYVAIQQEMKREDTELDRFMKKQAGNIKADKFLLMVAGEAKSGKSTFINAYLGEDILPMDVKQCTSAIVEIKYSKKLSLTATYADGRSETYDSEQEVKDFLKLHAALDDEYRDIPITSINNEILVKYKGKNIRENVIRDLLDGVQEENIYNLPKEEYEKKIRKYISVKQSKWMNIVVKMEIKYPLNEELKGVQIVDSPGVNALGRVGDITDEYITNANAIMFLKPITGSALESSSFKKFFNSTSVNRNRNALFLVLTRAANETQQNIDKLYGEACRMYSKIRKEQIVYVDSKIELFLNRIKDKTMEEIKTIMKEMTEAKTLDDSIKAAFFDAFGDRDDFIAKLEEKSNFNIIQKSLNQFGRNSQYLAFISLLDNICNSYEKIRDNLESDIELKKMKMKDPSELAVKIAEIKASIDEIKNKMYKSVNKVKSKYTDDEKGLIRKRANLSIAEFKKDIEECEKINDFDYLEKISFEKIAEFQKFQNVMRQEIIEECNAELLKLSDSEHIKHTFLRPDFTEDTFHKIKEDARKNAKESHDVEEGITFKTTRRISGYSIKKHYELVSDSITRRLEDISELMIGDLVSYVNEEVSVYLNSLKLNAEEKKKRLDELFEDEKTAKEQLEEIEQKEHFHKDIVEAYGKALEIKGGLEANVR